MNKIEEHQLQKWEKEPLRHRNEIEQAERAMSEEFCISVRNYAGHSHTCKANASDDEAALKHKLDYVRLWNRLTALVAVIARHDANVYHAKAQAHLRRQLVQGGSLLRHICIVSDVASFFQSVNQNEMQLFLNAFPAKGEA